MVVALFAVGDREAAYRFLRKHARTANTESGGCDRPLGGDKDFRRNF
jgi:hypothetical protein